MKFLLAELKKMLTRRFLGLLAVALIANFLLYWHDRSTDYINQNRADYLAVQRDVIAMGEEDGYRYLQERMRMLEACMSWEDYNKHPSDQQAGQITEDMLEYREIYESGQYLCYSTNLFQERTAVRSALREMERIQNHQSILETAIAAAKLKMSFSIFAQKNSFTYRSQQAVVERLEQRMHIKPSFDVSEGVLFSQNAPVTDLLALMLIIYICVEIIVTEHKNGMLPILRATQEGRLPLILAKVAAVWILILVIVVSMWGTNLVYSAGLYGLGDLSRPVQSLTGFSASTLEMSVGNYMVLFFLLKWVLYATVGIGCMVLCLMLQNTPAVWLSVGGFLCVEYVLWQTVPAVSAWSFFKYCNIGCLIFGADWILEYRDLNVLGYPVPIFSGCGGLTAVLFVVGTVSLCRQFCNRRVRVPVYRPVCLIWPQWLPRPGQSTVLFGHELWKLLIECGTLAVLILFAAINLQEPRTVTYGTEDLYYKNYMETLAGPMNLEKDAFLEQEAQRFADVHRQLQQLEQSYAEGKITQDDMEILQQPLKRVLEAEKVLVEKVSTHIHFVKSQLVKGKSAWVIYEPGYEYLFGLDPQHSKAATAAILIAGIILSFANLYPLETATGMESLLNVYNRGRKNTAWSKVGICLLLTVILYGIAQIPEYWYVAKNYGFPSVTAPLCSLRGFAAWSDKVSILGGIFIFEGLRLMSAMTVALIVLMVCQWTRNQLLAISTSVGVLLLPLLIHLMGVDFLDIFSFFRPLTGTSLMCAVNPLPLSLLYYGITAILGVMAILQILRSAGRGTASGGRRRGQSFR